MRRYPSSWDYLRGISSHCRALSDSPVPPTLRFSGIHPKAAASWKRHPEGILSHHPLPDTRSLLQTALAPRSGNFLLLFQEFGILSLSFSVLVRPHSTQTFLSRGTSAFWRNHFIVSDPFPFLIGGISAHLLVFVVWSCTELLPWFLSWVSSALIRTGLAPGL